MLQDTFLFVSKRIHERWVSRKPYHPTVIDNLESFIWVALWAYLRRTDRDPESYMEMTWLHPMWVIWSPSSKPHPVLLLKELFLDWSSSWGDRFRKRGIDCDMLTLFHSLGNVARQGREFLDEIGLEDEAPPDSLADNIWNRALEQYGAYLQVLYKWLHGQSDC